MGESKEVLTGGTVVDYGTKDEPKAEEEEEGTYSIKGVVFPMLVCTLMDLNFAMLVTFLPKVAGEKGLSTYLIGNLFAILNLSAVCTTLVVPKISKKVGGNRLFAYVCLAQAVFVSLMGLTGMITDSTTFFLVCFILRFLQGIPSSIIDVTAVGIVMRSVPKKEAGEAAGWLEGARVLGYCLGPLFGAYVYNSLGYAAPFFFTASIVGASALYLLLISPFEASIDNVNTDENKGKQDETFMLVRRPVIIVAMGLTAALSSVGTFLEPILEPFLAKEPYHFSNVVTGLLFFMNSVYFAAGTGIPSSLRHDKAILFGFVCIAAGFVTVAPPAHFTNILSLFAFLHQSSHAGSVFALNFGMFLLSIGSGFMITPIFNIMLEEAEYIGLPVSKASDSVAALNVFAFTTGAFLGPFTSGYLVDKIGFPRACTAFGLFLLISVKLLVSRMNRDLDQRQEKLEPEVSGESVSLVV